MSLTKGNISSPLEAGTSILDVQNLPPRLQEALEYASKRLVRKSIHATLVVLRREYQLSSTSNNLASASSLTPLQSPQIASPLSLATPTPTSSSSPATPKIVHRAASTSSSRLAFAASPVMSFKKLVRTATAPSVSSLPSSATPIARPAGLDDSPRWRRHGWTHPVLRWPQSPSSSHMPSPPLPMTPATASSAATDASMPPTPGSFGVRLILADLLTDKQEKFLRQTLERAEAKFGVGPEWLPQPLSATTCGLSNLLINRSVLQNEVLFASAGITLISLDRLYTFKSALASYTRTGSPLRLEDAVDELRRLILLRRSKTSLADLQRSYDWLRISDVALGEVDRMYRRAYGGVEKTGGIEGMKSNDEAGKEGAVGEKWDSEQDSDTETTFDTDSESTAGAEHTLSSSSGSGSQGCLSEDESEAGAERNPTPRPEQGDVTISFSPDDVRIDKTPSSPRAAPVLKLQTQFGSAQSGVFCRPIPQKGAQAAAHLKRDDAEEDQQLTAKPGRQSKFLHRQSDQIWSPISIAEVLNDEVRSPSRQGPMTPNGYDDISPVTRGEWGFLMGGRGGVQQNLKTAAVVTW